MTDTQRLAAAELHIRIMREEAHARKAMALLAIARPGQRIRRSSYGGPERLDSYAWRTAKRHMRRAAKSRADLAKLEGLTP